MLIEGLSPLRPQEADNFLRREEIIFPLLATAVGILGAVEAALWGGHLPENEIRRPFRRQQVQFLSGSAVCLTIGQNQQGVVI